MENIISSCEVAGVDSEPAKASIEPNEPDSKCRSSSKRRSKTRSKVWEKVAWFTRKAKSSRENKVESLGEARKDEKNPSLSVPRSEEQEEANKLNSTVSKLNSSSFRKTKTKSGIRKTRSFNYLKRKKLKHYASEASSSLQEENKENADPTSTSCQTATGNFHDFASSFGRKCSNSTASTTLLVSEMAKQMNFKQKQEEQLKESVKSSLSLPLSLLSLNEKPVPGEVCRSVCSQSCQGLLCSCKPRNKSFSSPSYNSWPRKKRLLTANQSYEAFSPPQKQKRICGLRKTATFSGFDSSKLCLKEFKSTGRELRMGKSTPVLSGHNQIKNQNGLTIGVIHFFKSSRNEYSIVSKDGCVREATLPNDVNGLDMCGKCPTKQTIDANTDVDVVGNIGISDAMHSNLCLEAIMSDDTKESTLQSDSLDNEFFAENEQYSAEERGNTEDISKDLTVSANTSANTGAAIVSTKDCFVVKDPFNEVTCLISQYQTSQQENIRQSNTLEKGIQQLSECLLSSSDNEEIPLGSNETSNSSDARGLELVDLNSLQELCETDKRTAYIKLDIIREIPDSPATVNTKNIESSKEYDEHCIAQMEGIPESSQASETGIYCIKIEDQVTDFAKEGKIDFQAQTKLQSPSTLSNPIIEELKDNTCIKENPLFQSADNSHTSETLCTMTNGTAAEEKDEKTASERNTFNYPVMPSNMVTLNEGKTISKNDGSILPKVNSNFSFKAPLKSSVENKIPDNQSKEILGSSLQQTSRILFKQGKPKVDGPNFKHHTETILDWFSEFNDEQKNILIKKLLEQCELPQMHLLSVLMEPILHKTCPSNCQDMLAWLPHTVTNAVMSYLDPESLCRCSQVNRFWNSLASNPLVWKGLCKSSEWQLSRKTEEKQLMVYTLPCGTVQWKKMFAERYLLRRNWLNGRCKVRTFEGHTQGISCVQFDDTRIVSGSTDKTIKVWDLSRDDSHAVLTLAGHSGTVRCLNLNGNRLVSGSVDRSIKVWDLSFESYWSGASCKVTMVGHMHTVRCLQVDDEKVVSGSYDKTLKVWDLKTGLCKLTLRGHNAAVLCVQFDDNKIVSGSYDNTIKVWSLHEGECLMTLAGHHDAVTCLNLTQDGRKVISGSLDHNLKFWDLATGKCIGTLDWIRSEGHTGVIRCLQSDSWRIVSAGDDKTLKMWSLETGQRLLTLRCHTDGVTCLQFNDYRIVSGSYDKTVKVWNFSPEHEFLNPS